MRVGERIELVGDAVADVRIFRSGGEADLQWLSRRGSGVGRIACGDETVDRRDEQGYSWTLRALTALPFLRLAVQSVWTDIE